MPESISLFQEALPLERVRMFIGEQQIAGQDPSSPAIVVNWPGR